jgi:hypothetical protein
MMTRRLIHLVIILGVLAACGSPAPQPQPLAGTNTGATAAPPAPLATAEKVNVEVGPNEPQVFMLEPSDGAALDSPFFMRIGVSNLTVPIDNLKIHVAVDTTCTPAGQVVPQDAYHISLPQGELTNRRFALPMGQHRLCIQAANRDNMVLDGPGMTRVIDVLINSVHQPSND